MLSAFSALSNNKLYLENNLLPLQIFYHNRVQMMSKLTETERCVLNRLWNQYEELIEQDTYLMIRVKEDEYRMFKYERINKNTLKISLDSDQVGIYNFGGLTPNISKTVSDKDVFLGVYKPLSILSCNDLRVIDVGKTIPFDQEKSKALMSIWMKVEQLRLSIETFLESVEISHMKW